MHSYEPPFKVTAKYVTELIKLLPSPGQKEKKKKKKKRHFPHACESVRLFNSAYATLFQAADVKTPSTNVKRN